MRAQRPLLFVDVDGVLNPYAAASCPDGFAEHHLFPDEDPVRLCQLHGGWLHDLSRAFDLVWGTSWNSAERVLLAGILQLPAFGGAATLPDGPFEPRLKVPAVDAVAADRAVAWIDDLLTAEAWDWAGRRAAPTLLLPIDPAVGLARTDVDTLLAWADHLSDA